MLLARIESFLAVARTQSVSRAADELFVTQPALTARLRELERELGAELFLRLPRGMRLTEAGHVFLPYAERAVAALREGRERVEQLVREGGDVLILAAPPGVSTYTLPPILERFTLERPHVAISVRTGHTEEVLGMVLREEVQLGLGRAIRHPDIESVMLYEDEIVLVTVANSPLAERERVSLLDIEGERLILFDTASSYYELTRALFSAAGIAVNRTIELDNIEAAKRMVERGLGVALLPMTSVSRDVAEGRLAMLAIDGSPAIRRPIVAFRRKDVPELRNVAAFLATARELLTG